MLMSPQGQDKGALSLQVDWPRVKTDLTLTPSPSQEPRGYLQPTWQKQGWGGRQEGGFLCLISAASQAFNLCLCVSLCSPRVPSLTSAASLLSSLCLHL